MTRSDWDLYFMDMARAASARSSCPRAHVGAILVKDRQVVSTGYNGAIAGQPHCDDVGCLVINDACQRAVHSECNAIFSAAKRGASTDGSECFCTHFPCWPCFRSLAQSGIKRIVFNEWKANRMTPEIYNEIVKTPIEIVDLQGRKFADIITVKDGQIIPQ